VLICSKQRGPFVLFARAKGEKMRGTEARYGQARMEVADCVGVDPGVRLAALT